MTIHDEGAIVTGYEDGETLEQQLYQGVDSEFYVVSALLFAGYLLASSLVLCAVIRTRHAAPRGSAITG